MYIVRPVDFSDLPSLERLAQRAGIGFTNFPANRDRLNDKIAASKRAMQMMVDKPGDESYGFVLVTSDTNDVVGFAGLESMVGTNAPFYNYRIDEVVHASPQLQIHNRISALFLCHDYTGTSRLMSLVIDKAHQNATALSLLSRSRLLFIAQYPERFTHRIFVELRGESDEHGYSPFWEALGKHFFSMDFQKADYLSGVSNKNFIADLMPRYPIYVPTLPMAAQEVIGVVHEDSEATTDILLQEGFEFRGYVDIFDAGPTVESRTLDLNTIAHRQIGTLCHRSPDKTAPIYLISVGQMEQFRAIASAAIADENSLCIDKNAFEQLGIHEGENAQWIAL